MESSSNRKNLVITQEYKTVFSDTLMNTYFYGWNEAYLSSDAGKADIENHVCGRMIDVQNSMIPWVEEVYSIKDKFVLEIGCGTGSATVPFAIKTKKIDAYDISNISLKAAKKRASLLGVDNINFHLLDPDWAKSSNKIEELCVSVSNADVILLMALLEHLTIDERINLLHGIWNILKDDAIIIIYETPNRIGFYDWHSFLLPFFHSLPDQLALLYANKTPRAFFTDQLKGNLNEEIYRLGRGISYHEFELAIDFNELSVINDGFSSYLTHRISLSHPAFDEALFEIFDKYLPYIPKGFLCSSLDLIIKKHKNHLISTGNKKHNHIPVVTKENLVKEVNCLKQQLNTAQVELERARGQIELINRSLTVKLVSKMQNFRIYRIIAGIVRYLYDLKNYK